LLLLGFVSLPVMAFASLTRNMTQVVIGGVILVASFAISLQLQAGHAYNATASTGLIWISLCSSVAVLLVGATIIFTVQYFRRKTTLSRWLAVCVFALAYSMRYIPWDLAFRLQERLPSMPGAGGSVIAVYEPSLGKFRFPEGMDRDLAAGRGAGERDEASTVYVPIHVIGLPDHGVLNADKSLVRLLAADDKVLYTGSGDELLIRKEGQQDPVHFTMGSRSVGFEREINTSDLSVPQNGEVWIYQGIVFPRGRYGHIKSLALRLEINYSLTLFQGNSYAIPALGGHQVVPGLGRCTTKMDDDGDDVDLRCIQAGQASSCASVFLEHVPSGQRNPTFFSCRPFYAPFLVQFVPDGISRPEAGIRFHDLSGLAKYPVDAAQLRESRVVIRVYQAQDHFTRQIVIPEIRLSNWESIEHNQVAENR
jgi:hypothetical protein